MSSTYGDRVQRGRFGYPRWLSTILLVDIWERLSFYGMQAILVLYAAAPASAGGLGLPAGQAAALFGVYIGSAFVLSLPGSWIGDRVLGERRAVLCGGVIIAAGHFCLAVPGSFGAPTFSYAGLILVALGTGLFKPNIVALLGRFYGDDEAAQRASAISIFYVIGQISALLAPLITGLLGEGVNWHAGFAAAGVGMLLGLLQYLAGRRRFGLAGSRPGQPLAADERGRAALVAAAVVAVLAALVAVDVASGAFSPMHVVMAFGIVTLIMPFSYFAVLSRQRGWTTVQRTRLRSFFWLLLSVSLFWLMVGQAGSLLTLFAKHSTDRSLFGLTLPASWFQAAIPAFMLLVAPVFAYLWVRLGPRSSTPGKFALGLFFAGLSFSLMSVAAALAGTGVLVSPLWLIAVFFLQACGEVVVGPVAMSAAAEVAPKAYVGRVIGLVWLFSALGAGLGAQVVRLADVVPHQFYYLGQGATALTAAAVLVVFGARLRSAFAHSAAVSSHRPAPVAGPAKR
ncbi:peptide MFS transporter [Fodinicola acaciae]|uniref:peptide MFS transporter n=1 Tax=Fodinicola acaciae TaxID=2681555 RepID=UPI0013D560D0|nr:oligopeptide:H+ symporter [Fodinicola acaciae]